MAPTRDPRYEQTRRHFDDLDPEEKARFLVEATASTVAQGVLTLGRHLAEGLEDLMREARPSSRPSGPGPAEPETAQRRTPRSGAGSSS
jgi:hypothetical protein